MLEFLRWNVMLHQLDRMFVFHSVENMSLYNEVIIIGSWCNKLVLKTFFISKINPDFTI